MQVTNAFSSKSGLIAGIGSPKAASTTVLAISRPRYALVETAHKPANILQALPPLSQCFCLRLRAFLLLEFSRSDVSISFALRGNNNLVNALTPRRHSMIELCPHRHLKPGGSGYSSQHTRRRRWRIDSQAISFAARATLAMVEVLTSQGSSPHRKARRTHREMQ